MSSPSVDWRNRFGWNWLTNIKDQGGCGSCYIFSAVGVVEAMLRIEHSVVAAFGRRRRRLHRSYCGGHAKCQGGSPNEVLDWIKTNGVADPGCWPYVDYDQTGQGIIGWLYRKARQLRHVLRSRQYEDVDDLNGPMMARFSCCDDFDGACKNNAMLARPIRRISRPRTDIASSSSATTTARRLGSFATAGEPAGAQTAMAGLGTGRALTAWNTTKLRHLGLRHQS